MSTLLDVAPAVHSTFPIRAPSIPIEYFGEPTGPEPEPFHPSAEDQSFDLGYGLGRDACASASRFRREAGMTIPLQVAYIRGFEAGSVARLLEDAYELGWMMGLEDSIPEPPTGFTDGEKAAYRRGFKAGLAERQDDLEFDAWVREREAERDELAFADPITDADIYHLGVN